MPVAVPLKRVRNVYMGRSHRAIWQRGGLSLLRSDADVVVCPEIVYNGTVWAIRILHRWYRKPLVLIGFFFRPNQRRFFDPLRDALRRILVGSASSVIAYTDRGRAERIAAGMDPSRVFVSNNTLDTVRLSQLASQVTESEVDSLRRQLDLGDRRVLLFLGRLVPEKRVGVLLEALRKWPTAERPVALVIGDGPERESLEASAGETARFVGSDYDEVRLSRYLALADLLVLPGRVGLTPVHGFASGVPCVTTADNAVDQSPEYEYIRDGYNGVVLSRPDPELYARALLGILDDREVMERLRSGARDSATRLGMDAMVEAFVGAVVKAAATEAP
jgi:glycosyltransferase involved in cell wall biosynthesis